MLLKELRNQSPAFVGYEIAKHARKLGFGLRNVQPSSKAGKGQTWIGGTFIETNSAEFKGKNKYFPEVGNLFYIAFTFKKNIFAMRAWYFNNGKLTPIGFENRQLISDDITLADCMAEMREVFDLDIRPYLNDAIKQFREDKK